MGMTDQFSWKNFPTNERCLDIYQSKRESKQELLAVLNVVELADRVPKSYVLGPVLFNMFINSLKTDRLLK